MKFLPNIFLCLLFALPMLVNAQSISGKVTSSDGPAIGANVVATPGDRGVVTDIDGNYTLNLDPGTYTIKISYIGCAPQENKIAIGAEERMTWDVVLLDDATSLDELLVVGTRTAPRSNTTSPLPIDVVKAAELESTGQGTLDKMLGVKAPSFNTVQTPVNDATALLDPYEIRNMGPSRTLILINGKRKNSSSLIYTQTSPGKGESGADLSAIPIDAIKRIEILRDGASAQYGSDAIAGVVNIILKDYEDEGTFKLRTGITAEGDGASIGASLNNGSKIGKNGFLNYTIDLSKTGRANRPGTVDAGGEIVDFTDGTAADTAFVNSFLEARPDAGNVNGTPTITAAKFLVNGGFQVSDNVDMYANAAYIYKKANSFANYRTPYWRPTDFGLLTPEGETYDGYLPTFDGDLTDYNATVGFKSEKNGWYSDVSFTTGGNTQTYLVKNTVNRGLGAGSPIEFRQGGYNFNHNVGNVDITKRFEPFNEMFAIAFGSEFRSENFTIIEGDSASYAAGGSDSFAGNTEDVAGTNNRYNFGGYFSVDADITDDFLISATGRLENYSDFGNAYVVKGSTRYKFLEDKMTFRGSVSSGFRAPSLHQLYVQKTQYSFVAGSGIQVEGLINNSSPQAKLLAIPALEPEKSLNITVGFGARPIPGLSLTLDYYNVSVKDRIVLSNNIQFDEFSSLGQAGVNFFVNGLDSRTSGIDFVAAYSGLELGPGRLGADLSLNYMISNEREGELNTPRKVIEEADGSPAILDSEDEALLFTSRPKFKAILGLDYVMDKLSVGINNTLYGTTRFHNNGLTTYQTEQADGSNYTATHLEQVFKSKVVTDLSIAYDITDRFNIAFNVNNIANVKPEWKFIALTDAADRDAVRVGVAAANPGETAAQISTRLEGLGWGTDEIPKTGEAILADPVLAGVESNLITFNQRYSTMGYDGYHFSQLGTSFALALTLRF